MPLELFRANVDRAIKGKRGQKVLRELREALLALPEKKLVQNALCVAHLDDDDNWVPGGFCAVGALSRFRRLKAGEPLEKIVEALRQDPEEGDYEYETVAEGRRLGIVECLAFELAYVNDDGLDQWRKEITDEERYARYLAWLDEHIVAGSPEAG